MDDKTIENKIDEIHDMLIDYMNEDAASPILEKIRMFVEKVRSDGYHDGCNDSQKAFFRLATP